MLNLFLINSVLFISQLVNYNTKFTTEFRQLKHKLEDYGFEVRIAIPPDYQLPQQQTDFQRRRLRKPYALLVSSRKLIWLNPIVFELGISNPVLIHEAVHAAQLCQGNGSLQALKLDLEPIKQAQPFFKRYVDIYNQELEKEAYTVQTQPNSYELAISLLDKHCQ